MNSPLRPSSPLRSSSGGKTLFTSPESGGVAVTTTGKMPEKVLSLLTMELERIGEARTTSLVADVFQNVLVQTQLYLLFTFLKRFGCFSRLLLNLLTRKNRLMQS